jgi:hypothetical protein
MLWAVRCSAVRIEKRLVAIETQPLLRRGQPINAVGVELTRYDARHKNMPIMVSTLHMPIEIDGARRPGIVNLVKEQQLDRGRVARIDAEVDAAVDQRGAEWKASAIREDRERLRRHFIAP